MIWRNDSFAGDGTSSARRLEFFDGERAERRQRLDRAVAFHKRTGQSWREILAEEEIRFGGRLL